MPAAAVSARLNRAALRPATSGANVRRRHIAAWHGLRKAVVEIVIAVAVRHGVVVTTAT